MSASSSGRPLAPSNKENVRPNEDTFVVPSASKISLVTKKRTAVHFVVDQDVSVRGHANLDDTTASQFAGRLGVLEQVTSTPAQQIRWADEGSGGLPRSRRVVNNLTRTLDTSVVHTMTRTVVTREVVGAERRPSPTEDKTFTVAEHDDPSATPRPQVESEPAELRYSSWCNKVLRTEFEEELSTAEKAVGNGSDSKKLLLFLSGAKGKDSVPTKEAVSRTFYCASNAALNDLRRRASQLYTEMGPLVEKVKTAVETKVFFIRDDRQIHADVGLRVMIFQIFRSFNPLWLRLALETTFGEVIEHGPEDSLTYLWRFAIERVLNDPAVQRRYGHRTVHSMLRQGGAEAIAQAFLKKILCLLIFMDTAKKSRLIAQDPCLFLRNSPYKSVESVLLKLISELISGEGNLLKALKRFGFVPSCKQNFLDEYKYCLHNVATDLRNGVILARVAELLMHKPGGLAPKLLHPPISRLQKLHNVRVVMNAFEQDGIDLENIEARHVTDGNKDWTLEFLRRIVERYQGGEVHEETAVRKQQMPKRNRSNEDVHKTAITTAARVKMREDLRLQLLQQRSALKIQTWWRKTIARHRSFTSENRAAIKIQSWWRAQMARRKFIQRRSALIVIQRWWSSTRLMLTVRNQYLLLRHSATVIQKAYRAKHKQQLRDTRERSARIIGRWWRTETTRRNFLLKRSSAVVIQSAWRAHHHQRSYALQKMSAVKIQSWWRAQVARRRFMEQQSALIVIQRWWSATRLMITVRNEYLLTRHSAMVIQKAYRAKHQREIEATKEDSARIISRWWRTKRARRNFLLQRTSAVAIQSAWRAHHHQRHYALRKLSALKIQMWWRAQTARKNKKKQSTIKIQSWWRSRIARRRFKQQQNATVIIQRWWSSTQRMMAIREEFLIMRQSATIIQKAYRAMRQQQIQNTRDKSARIIGRWWRTKTARHNFLLRRSSAVLIQSAWRAQHHQRSYALQKMSAVKIQSWWRTQIARRRFIQQRSSVTIIHRWWSSTRLMMAIREEYLLMVQSARIIQKAYRAKRQRDIQKSKENSARVISRWWRTKRARQNFLLQRSSTVVIQCAWRAHHCQRRFALQKLSAVKIQAWWRTQIAQQTFIQQQNAVIVIQRWWSSTRLMMAVREEYLLMCHSAIIIQKAYRTKRQQQLQDTREKSARMIGRWWQTKTARRNFLLRRSSAVVIQSAWRAHHHQRSYTLQKKSAVKIQMWWRTTVARHHHLTSQRCAAITIQAWWRTQIARRNFVQQQSAVTIIQRWWSSTQLMTAIREEYRLMRHSATVIQKAYRAMRQQQIQDTRERSARTIGRWWRAKSVRRDFLLRRSSAVVIQSAWRAHHHLHSYTLQKKSAVKIQTWWRTTIARHHHVTSQRHAAIKIQSWWRTHFAQQKFTQQQSAVTIIQRWWSSTRLMVAIREEYLLMRHSAKVIQKAYRAMRQREIQTAKEYSATMISRWWRSKITRQNFLLQRSSSVVIQCAWRAHHHRRRFALQKLSAVKIQTWWRRQEAQRRLAKKHRAAVVIQARIRGMLARKRLDPLSRHKMEKIRCALAVHQPSARQTLGWRCEEAVELLLRDKRMPAIRKALRELEVTTHFSAVCCVTLVNAGIIPLLFELLHDMNRGSSCNDVTVLLIKVLINIARYRETASAVFAQSEWLSLVMLPLQANVPDVRGTKSKELFVECCVLLSAVSHQEVVRHQIAQNHDRVRDRLCSVYNKTMQVVRAIDSRKSKQVEVRVRSELGKAEARLALNHIREEADQLAVEATNSPFTPYFMLNSLRGHGWMDSSRAIQIVMTRLQINVDN